MYKYFGTARADLDELENEDLEYLRSEIFHTEEELELLDEEFDEDDIDEDMII